MLRRVMTERGFDFIAAMLSASTERRGSTIETPFSLGAARELNTSESGSHGSHVLSMSRATFAAIGTKVPTNGDVRPYFIDLLLVHTA
jgi:hypothetical protein